MIEIVLSVSSSQKGFSQPITLIRDNGTWALLLLFSFIGFFLTRFFLLILLVKKNRFPESKGKFRESDQVFF